MSEDVAARIAALANDYREGRLNLPAYRRLRGPLLDSLATRPFSAEDEATVTQPRDKVRAAIAEAAAAAAAVEESGNTVVQKAAAAPPQNPDVTAPHFRATQAAQNASAAAAQNPPAAPGVASALSAGAGLQAGGAPTPKTGNTGP